MFKALIPATQWIKVYRFNEDYKTLSVSPTTSASEIISLALEKFRMTETADQFILCEVRLNDCESLLHFSGFHKPKIFFFQKKNSMRDPPPL